MLDTVLNLGLNNASVQGLARATGNERFAWDSYRRFVQMFGNVVRGIAGERIEEEIAALKTRRGVELDTDLGVDDLRELVATFGAIYREQTGEDFPQEPREQLRQAIRAVFDSWNGERAVQYRRLNRIPDEWGTAVNVQQMVFGNKGETIGSGVAFSRDEITGAPEPSGDFLVNAQGEDVVSGVRNTQDLAELPMSCPTPTPSCSRSCARWSATTATCRTPSSRSRRGGCTCSRRAAPSARRRRPCASPSTPSRRACSTRREALATIDAASLDALLHPTFDPDVEYEVLARGVAASPGAAKGEIVFTRRRGGRRRRGRRDVILVRPFTEADDVAGFHAAQGILTSEGGKASHAALVARGMGRPCVAGASELEIDLAERRPCGSATRAARGRPDRDQRHDRRRHGRRRPADRARDHRAVPDRPAVGRRAAPAGRAHERRHARGRRGARATSAPRASGCAGPSTCSWRATASRKMRAMIMADDEERRAALDELLPHQQEDFEGLFEAMEGLPVTIRLLDPPLHEFLPAPPRGPAGGRARAHRAGRRPAPSSSARSSGSPSSPRPTRCSEPAACRLGILYPEIFEMQVVAIVRAAAGGARADRPGAARRDHGAADRLRAGVGVPARAHRAAAAREGACEGEDFTVGTMIELPRACFVADRIAQHADFFSFGTNDLTQTALGFSRDDIEGKILAKYIDRRILDRSPFETIDRPGVGWLVRLAAWVGREARPDLKLGICGEHGGDPDSIEFFPDAGLDYVSCSPYRVPVARVAAAQAAIRAE